MNGMHKTVGFWLKKVGLHRGSPRLWFDSIRVASAGMIPGGRFDVVALTTGLKLVASDVGRYAVSSKERDGKRVPVIDINSREVLAPLDGHQVVRVVVRTDGIFVMPLASEVAKRERVDRLKAKLESGEPILSASIAHGGGVLSHAAHAGMAEAGVPMELAVFCEIDEGYVEQSLCKNEATTDRALPLCAPIQELVQDEWAMKQVPRVEVLEMGLPCSGASRAGKSKRGLGMMEQHPEVGHLVYAALALIQKLQPAAVVLENVEDYSVSASAQILRSQLRDMGYQVREHVLGARDYGLLENRVRWALVATTDGLRPVEEPPATVINGSLKLGDLLDAVDEDAKCWSEMRYLKDKAVRDKEAGKGFAMQLVSGDSTSVPTIRKSYNKGGSTDPFVRHPSNPDLMRKFTAAEHARIKGVPVELVEGLPATTAHEILGQGIAYTPFKLLFKELGRRFDELRANGPVWTGQCATGERLVAAIG